MPLVSIIVPIYKVEKYLRKCIDSILNQTLTDIEVILVNDGCPNGCGRIIDEYNQKDSRVVTIHKINGGQASARNAGLEVARGQFIGFIDPDDWIEPKMYERLFNAITLNNADISICGRRTYDDNGNIGTIIKPEDKKYDFNQTSKSQYIIENFFYPHTSSTCNKLYKHELIKKNFLRFKDVNYVGSEDTLFNYAILCNTNKIIAISEIMYNVLARSNSTVSTYFPGYMTRTSNLIKCLHDYSIKCNNLDLYNLSYPFIFLYFQQLNIERIITLANEDYKNIIANEIKEAVNLDYYRRSCIRIALDYRLTKNMKLLGYKLKGILFIRFFMLLNSLKLYNVATKFRILKII